MRRLLLLLTPAPVLILALLAPAFCQSPEGVRPAPFGH